MSEELIKRLADEAVHAAEMAILYRRGGAGFDADALRLFSEVMGEAAARISALIAAGDRLAGFAGHDDQCQIMTHGVWSDEVPCTCGYGAAWQAWRKETCHE